METRVFNYGGLSVQLIKSPVHGWVTTMAELAKGCGVCRDSLEVLVKKYGLVRKGSVVVAPELAENFRLIQPGRGPKPRYFWTIEGMTFVAMFLRTEQCEQFREEVLKTIKALEGQGFVNAAEVMGIIQALKEQIAELTATVDALKKDNQMLRDFAASTAGYALSKHRKVASRRVTH